MYTQVLMQDYIQPTLSFENQERAVVYLIKTSRSIFRFLGVLLLAIFEVLTMITVESYKKLKPLFKQLRERFNLNAKTSWPYVLEQVLNQTSATIETETEDDPDESFDDDVFDIPYDSTDDEVYLAPIEFLPDAMHFADFNKELVSEPMQQLCIQYTEMVPTCLFECFMVSDYGLSTEKALLYMHPELPKLLGFSLPDEAVDRFYTQQELKRLLKDIILEAANTNEQLHRYLAALVSTLRLNVIKEM